MRTSSIPIMHLLLKEYVKEEMRKGTYKEIPFQHIELIPYDEMEMEEELELDSELLVCFSYSFYFRGHSCSITVFYLYLTTAYKEEMSYPIPEEIT